MCYDREIPMNYLRGWSLAVTGSFSWNKIKWNLEYHAYGNEMEISNR